MLVLPIRFPCLIWMPFFVLVISNFYNIFCIVSISLVDFLLHILKIFVIGHLQLFLNAFVKHSCLIVSLRNDHLFRTKMLLTLSSMSVLTKLGIMVSIFAIFRFISFLLFFMIRLLKFNVETHGSKSRSNFLKSGSSLILRL